MKVTTNIATPPSNSSRAVGIPRVKVKSGAEAMVTTNA